MTLSVALDGALRTALSDQTLTLLSHAPQLVPTTFTENVQVPWAAIVPPVRLRVPEPAPPRRLPPHGTPETPHGVAACTPSGRKSLNPTFTSVVLVFGLWMVNVSTDVPFTLMVEGEKPVETVGGSMMVACAATSTARHTHSRITTAAAPP